MDTALAEESRMAARLLNDAEIEKYKRDFQVPTPLRYQPIYITDKRKAARIWAWQYSASR